MVMLHQFVYERIYTHEHQFKVKFSPNHLKKYSVYCDQPRTVLETIKTLNQYKKRISQDYPDENIIITTNIENFAFSVATHFSCSCIGDDQVLTILCEEEKVEKAQPDLERVIYAKDRYSIFYIDESRNLNNKLLINKGTKQLKHLCVYGKKGVTVEEALKRDGRFIDDLSNFELSREGNTMTECTQKVNNLNNNKFKICLPEQEKKKNTNPSDNTVPLHRQMSQAEGNSSVAGD